MSKYQDFDTLSFNIPLTKCHRKEAKLAVTAHAVTMGNFSDGYQYPTNVTFKGCQVILPAFAIMNADNHANSIPAVYAHANSGEGLGVTFNYDAATTFNSALEFDSTNITVNGTSILNAPYYIYY